MATPTLVNPPTIIDSAESTANWGGDSFSLEPDIKVAGSNSVACVQTNSGANDVYVSGSWDFSADETLRLWFNISYVGNLAASNKVQVFLHDGTNTAYWTVPKGETYAGGWLQAVIFTGNTPTSGTVNKSNITQIGMRFNTASKPRNVPANAWFDQWAYGDGYAVTGGSAVDPITPEDIAAVDKVSAYGIVSEVDGAIFLAGELLIGNGSTTTYYEDIGGVLVFKDLPVDTILYRIVGQGSGCNINIEGGVLTAAGNQDFDFDMDDGDLASFSMIGKQISKANACYFKSGQSIQNNVFDGCGRVTPGLSTFKFNTLTNYDGTGGAILFPSDDSNISDLSFINNSFGVEYGSTSDASSPSFDAFTFDDVSGKYDVNNTSGSSVTIAAVNGSNPNSYNPAGDTVTFQNSKIFKFNIKPSQTGYEWRLYSVTALGSLSGASELDGEESASQDNQTYSYNYSADQPIAVQIIDHSQEYEEAIEYYTLTENNQEVNIYLEVETNV
jgi:hypothetical protein